MNNYFYELIEFFQKGGFVLCVIFCISILLCYFSLQRYIFIKFEFKKEEKYILENLKKQNLNYEFHEFIKEYFISRAKFKLRKNLNIIKTLIIISPLLGLLGTVIGMINIFDSLFYNGSNDIKFIADGISMATIPTMAGMIVALFGIVFKTILENLIKKKIDRFLAFN